MKQIEVIPDLKAVNQDKKNILFSVSFSHQMIQTLMSCFRAELEDMNLITLDT